MFTQLMLMRHSATLITLGLLFGVAAFAQTPVLKETTRAQLSSAESANRSVTQDKQESKTDKGQQDASSVLEELRQQTETVQGSIVNERRPWVFATSGKRMELMSRR
jgi:TolA-binding protein